MTSHGVGRAIFIVLSLAPLTRIEAADGERAATFYAARISSKPGWEDLLIDPVSGDYIDAYLVAGALSRGYASYRRGALHLEAEAQVVYNFGVQDHWEFNVVPVLARWQRFPWNYRIATSAAFGLGLSYATQVPPIEVLLEGESNDWLIYWVAEITAGPPDGPWAVSLRLHHRSVAYGLLGEEGGMNAMGVGIRYRF